MVVTLTRAVKHNGSGRQHDTQERNANRHNERYVDMNMDCAADMYIGTYNRQSASVSDDTSEAESARGVAARGDVHGSRPLRIAVGYYKTIEGPQGVTDTPNGTQQAAEPEHQVSAATSPKQYLTTRQFQRRQRRRSSVQTLQTLQTLRLRGSWSELKRNQNS